MDIFQKILYIPPCVKVLSALRKTTEILRIVTSGLSDFPHTLKTNARLAYLEIGS